MQTDSWKKITRSIRTTFALIILFLVGSLLLPQTTRADFDDSFTDTNGTNLSSHNANYSYSGTLTIQNNAIAPTVSNGWVTISNNSFADGCMSIDETNQTSNTNINIRVQGDDLYQLIWWSNQWQLQGNYGGSSHVIANGGYGPNGTHTFKICAIGSTISAYLDGSLLGSGTDTGITGSGTQKLSNNGNTLDNLLLSY